MTRFWTLLLAALLFWQAGWAASHHATEGAASLVAALHRAQAAQGDGPAVAAAAPAEHDLGDGAACCAACHGLHHLLSAGRGGFVADATVQPVPSMAARFPSDWTGPPRDRPRWSAA
jgi:hypothetical protein